MRKYLYGFSAFVLGFVILSVSFLRSASVFPAYGFSSTSPLTSPSPSPSTPEITYSLPYPGKILPDSTLWYIKAIRDRVQLIMARDPLKKADLALLYADKRLGASLTLFQNNKPDLAVSVLTKGEKYLETASIYEKIAREKGLDTHDFLTKLATSSLKHREIIESQIMPLTPEDLKPEVVKVGDYAKSAYINCKQSLNSQGIPCPKNPFNGE